jgi:hypothetical protein
MLALYRLLPLRQLPTSEILNIPAAQRNFHERDRSARKVKGVARIMVVMFYCDEPMNLNYILANFTVGGVNLRVKFMEEQVKCHGIYDMYYELNINFSMVNIVSCSHVSTGFYVHFILEIRHAAPFSS